MATKFPSAEWIEQLVIEINSSQAYANAAKQWEGDVVFVIEENGGVYLDLWHGECRNAEFLSDPTTKPAKYTISATLERWQKVLEGKLDPVQGIMTRQLKLDGNLIQLMKYIKAAQELVRCATRIDTVY